MQKRDQDSKEAEDSGSRIGSIGDSRLRDSDVGLPMSLRQTDRPLVCPWADRRVSSDHHSTAEEGEEEEEEKEKEKEGEEKEEEEEEVERLILFFGLAF